MMLKAIQPFHLLKILNLYQTVMERFGPPNYKIQIHLLTKATSKIGITTLNSVREISVI